MRDAMDDVLDFVMIENASNRLSVDAGWRHQGFAHGFADGRNFVGHSQARQLENDAADEAIAVRMESIGCQPQHNVAGTDRASVFLEYR